MFSYCDIYSNTNKKHSEKDFAHSSKGNKSKCLTTFMYFWIELITLNFHSRINELKGHSIHFSC